MWLTCAVDGTDHAVSDAAFVAAQGGDGRYEALCRATVWAGSLASPPASRCTVCAAAAGEPLPPSRPGDRRAGGLWARFVPRASA
ncbi:hypothetical protein GCM10023200_57980 [Actinomycetospora chlora]|uniref:Uncharacterized protein n=2 Tax=Actinomycetospora chlora TaxID=663608 RepID=A0ABP9CPQ7_9PSEU